MIFWFIFRSLNQHFFFWITFFRKLKYFWTNNVQKKTANSSKFERTNLFFWNKFWKNDRRILKESYSIKRPIPVRKYLSFQSYQIRPSDSYSIIIVIVFVKNENKYYYYCCKKISYLSRVLRARQIIEFGKANYFNTYLKT